MISWKDSEGFFSSISRLIVLTQSCRVSVDQIPVDFPLIAYESKSIWTKTNRLNPCGIPTFVALLKCSVDMQTPQKVLSELPVKCLALSPPASVGMKDIWLTGRTEEDC